MSSGARRVKKFHHRPDETSDYTSHDTSLYTHGSTIATTTNCSPSSLRPSVLSFYDDEQDEQIAVKPFLKRSRDTHTTNPYCLTEPSPFHKIAKNRRALAPLHSNVQPQAGTYTKETLLQLRENTPKVVAPSCPQVLSEPKIILKGLLKPQDLGKLFRTTVRKDKDDTKPQLDFMEINKEKDYSSFPDIATVNAFMAEREHLLCQSLVDQNYYHHHVQEEELSKGGSDCYGGGVHRVQPVVPTIGDTSAIVMKIHQKAESAKLKIHQKAESAKKVFRDYHRWLKKTTVTAFQNLKKPKKIWHPCIRKSVILRRVCPRPKKERFGLYY